MEDDFITLPENLPRPIDDGTSDHLLGMIIPDMAFPSTDGTKLNLTKNDASIIILYFFPMMYLDEKKIPSGWNDIPGARGCTPQNIEINNHADDLLKYDTVPIGFTTQLIDELLEVSSKRRLNQTILSDENLELGKKLGIPTFQVENKTMYKHITLIIKKSKIIKIFYPIFPRDKHVFEVLKWLEDGVVFDEKNSSTK